MMELCMCTRIQCVLVVLCIAPSVLATASIDTASKKVSVVLGGTAQLPCHVVNLTSTQTEAHSCSVFATSVDSDQMVIWRFIDHDVTISTGNSLRVHGQKKYELYRPQDGGSGLTHWNLNVFDVQLADQGSYKCYLQGMPSVSVTHHVKVTDAPTVPPPPPANVTDCCVKEGVDTCALPLCDQSNLNDLTVLLNILNNGSCIDDNIYNILVCGHGGRNFLGCCIRSGVSPFCQKLCDYRSSDQTLDYRECIPSAWSINACVQGGQGLMPSQPVDVSGISIGNGIMVTWQPPQENTKLVTGYIVHYRKLSDKIYDSTTRLPATATFQAVQNLELNTIYEVRVVAVGSAGASQPSYSVQVATGEPMNNTAISRSIQACCVQQGVSDPCLSFCSGDAFIHPDSVLGCYTELDKISVCLVGQRNHTPCCERSRVPEACYPLCAGKMLANGAWYTTNCVLALPVISACVMEGSSLLPSPPQKTHLVPGSVTSSSATVSWQPPTDFKAGDSFVVAWRVNAGGNWSAVDTDWERVPVLSGTQHMITGLVPATVYSVIVSTVNQNGSSLPETTLVFVTEGLSKQNTEPYNETQCCLDKGVTSACLDICNHTFRLTDAVYNLGIICYMHLPNMLQCASDGRDHTACCKKREVPAFCTRNLCGKIFLDSVSADFVSCLTSKDDLSICMDEGKEYIPYPPENVTIKAVQSDSFVVDWAAPSSGPNVTKYRVEYRQSYTSWMQVSTTNTFLKIDNLDANVYYVRVFSLNEERDGGVSLPSVEVRLVTKYNPPVKPIDWTQVWQNRSECCHKQVSDPCQASCLNPTNIELATCSKDLHKILACSADGRNHTMCCKRYENFPDTCLPFCAGQIPTMNLQAALCFNYVSNMFTCFSEGQGLLPTPPLNVRVVEVTQTSITLQWDAASTNCDGCGYMPMIWPYTNSKDKNVSKYKTKVLMYTFAGLKPLTTYIVSVVTRNKHGDSLPSPYIKEMTAQPDASKAVYVSQFPTIVDMGTRVSLECSFKGSAKSVTWIRNKTPKYKGMKLVLEDVKQTDEGNYICSVVFDNTTLTKSHFLSVRYSPDPYQMIEPSVLPGLHKEAPIRCDFKGFPDVITWTKDHQELKNPNAYRDPLRVDLTKGITFTTLRLRDFSMSDFGNYTCEGSNKFGSGKLDGVLENNFPTRPPPPTAGPKTNLADCCRSRGVPELCIPAICTYTIDIAAVAFNTSLQGCTNYFEDFITCGVDGKDHSTCCTGQGVDEYCLPFCKGVVPEFNDTTELLQCMMESFNIINCIVDAQQYIPTAPRSVKAQLSFDIIRVIWDGPEKNEDKVKKYRVFYKTDSHKSGVYNTTRSLRSVEIPGLVKGDMYYVWVVAVNEYGTSQPSQNISLKITAVLPSEPTNLQGSFTSDDLVTMRLTWTRPNTMAPLTGYMVTYTALPNGKPMELRVLASTTRLDRLAQNTKYRITVAAYNNDGVGKVSHSINLKTGQVSGSTVVTAPHTGDNNTNSVGLAVGLTLGVVLLVIVTFVAVLLFRRVQTKKATAEIQDRVAFENPNYSSGQQISGLPGDSAAEDKQFQYGHLQEESEQAYIPNPVANEAAAPNAAVNMGYTQDSTS